MARLIKYWILISLMTIYTLKYAVLIFYSEEWLLALLGEFGYKLYKIKITALCALTIGFTAFIHPFNKPSPSMVR